MTARRLDDMIRRFVDARVFAMLLRNLLHYPRRVFLRRVLFQVHLWAGIGVGLYVLVVGATGSILVFRGEIEAQLHPEVLRAGETSGSSVGIAAVADTVRAAYPRARMLGIYAPGGERETFIAWLAENDEIEPVFVHPTTGAILGARPENSWLGWLQDLHFYLLGGELGLTVNGAGALCLLALALTGLVVWWPGVGRWRRALGVDLERPLRRINRDLHGAVGFWTSCLIVMWAASGAYFAFPAQFRSVVDWISPLGALHPPASRAAGAAAGTPDLGSLIATAAGAVPGATVARVSFPDTEADAIQVVVAPEGVRKANEIGYVSFFFDQHDGELLERRTHAVTSAGDAVIAWIGAVHTGSFGGLAVKILWAVLGLAPALLCVTGLLMWWQRVVRRQLRRRGLRRAADRRSGRPHELPGIGRL